MASLSGQRSTLEAGLGLRELLSLLPEEKQRCVEPFDKVFENRKSSWAVVVVVFNLVQGCPGLQSEF